MRNIQFHLNLRQKRKILRSFLFLVLGKKMPTLQFCWVFWVVSPPPFFLQKWRDEWANLASTKELDGAPKMIKLHNNSLFIPQRHEELKTGPLPYDVSPFFSTSKHHLGCFFFILFSLRWWNHISRYIPLIFHVGKKELAAIFIHVLQTILKYAWQKKWWKTHDGIIHFFRNFSAIVLG